MAQNRPKLLEAIRLPSPKSAFEHQLVRVLTEQHLRIAQLVNELAEGRRAALYNETSAVPTSGTYAVGDFVPKKDPSATGTVGSVYVHYGWMCVQDGSASASSFVSLRALTGN